MIKIKLVLLLCIANFYFVEAQNENQPTIKKNSISVNILGTGSYLGISYERLLFERVTAEIGIGVFGYGIGVTVYPLKKISIKQPNLFIGLKYTNHTLVGIEKKSATYIPIGLTYFLKKRYNLSFDVGPSYFYHKSHGHNSNTGHQRAYYSDYGLWGNLKFGLRF